MHYTKYVLLARPRTGSTWLNQMLSMHPKVCARGEVFNPRSGNKADRAAALKYWLAPVAAELVHPHTEIRNKTGAAEILDTHLWHDGYRPDIEAVGFKLLSYQMQAIGRFRNLKERLRERLPGTKVILLDRGDKLQMHVSNLIAKRLKRWNVRDVAKRGEPPTMWLDAAELEQALHWYDRESAELSELAASAEGVYQLSYEELVRQTSVHWHKIQRFLGIEIIDLPETTTVKLETRHMRHAVENYDELSYHFAGTRWGRFFHEYPPSSYSRPDQSNGSAPRVQGNGRPLQRVREMELNIDPTIQPDFSSEHRSGWGYALQALERLHTRRGVLVDSFVERTFSWQLNEESASGRIPYREPWIGFMHNPPGVPKWHDYRHSPEVIIHRPVFQESLEKCLGIFVLSRYLQRWLSSHLETPIRHLVHPTEIPKRQFSFDAFLSNENKRVIQVGWWLRRLHSIHQLPAQSLRKTMLTVNNPYFPYTLQREKQILGLDDIDESGVEYLDFLTNGSYDEMLSKNLVFCHLYDSSANNTVIECIARNTPIVVNKLPAVIEYLGEDYPLYFDTLDEAADKSEDMETVHAAHEYLRRLPKENLSQQTFRDSFLDSRLCEH